MNLIAIETATENCSVGLLHLGEITQTSSVAPQKHAELVLVYLDQLLAAHDLKKTQIDGIVFGQGPGAFTGVRIAMSVVQGLALAWEVPVMAVSTMHNLALQVAQQNKDQEGQLLVANDARMNEVYWATFAIKQGQLERLTEDALNAPEDINSDGFDWCVGSAFQTMLTAGSKAQVMPDVLPDAASLLSLAQNNFKQQATHINDIKPAYIREKVVFN